MGMRESRSNKYVNKIWSNPRGEHRNTREELLSWGRWRARRPVGWGSEPGAVLERESLSEKEADHTATMSARAWSFLSETGCCYRGLQMSSIFSR